MHGNGDVTRRRTCAHVTYIHAHTPNHITLTLIQLIVMHAETEYVTHRGAIEQIDELEEVGEMSYICGMLSLIHI